MSRHELSVPAFLLTEPQAAAALGFTTPALRRLRYRNGTPDTIRIGDRVMYSVEDLKIWIDQHRVSSGAPRPVGQVKPQAARRPGRPSVRDRQAAMSAFPPPQQEGAG